MKLYGVVLDSINGDIVLREIAVVRETPLYYYVTKSSALTGWRTRVPKDLVACSQLLAFTPRAAWDRAETHALSQVAYYTEQMTEWREKLQAIHDAREAGR